MKQIFHALFIQLIVLSPIANAQDYYVGLKLTGIGVRVPDLKELNRLLGEAMYPKLGTVEYNVEMEGVFKLHKNHISVGYAHYFNPFEGYNQNDYVYARYKGTQADLWQIFLSLFC